MSIVEITIVPLGTASTSLSSYVSGCHRLIIQSGMKHQLTPMSSIVEGDLNKILDLVKRMHELPFENGAMRVSTTIRIDDRRDENASMEQKIESVRKKL